MQTPNSEPNLEKLEQRARNILLFQLSAGAKTAHQLAERLKVKEIPDELATRLIERFIEVGLIDDRAVAETISRSRREGKGWSNAAIRRDLIKRGVAKELIDEVLAPIDREVELATATRIATKQLLRMAKLEPEVAKRRLVGFLSRKGYSSSIVFEAIRQAQQASSQE